MPPEVFHSLSNSIGYQGSGSAQCGVSSYSPLAASERRTSAASIYARECGVISLWCARATCSQKQPQKWSAAKLECGTPRKSGTRMARRVSVPWLVALTLLKISVFSFFTRSASWGSTSRTAAGTECAQVGVPAVQPCTVMHAVPWRVASKSYDCCGMARQNAPYCAGLPPQTSPAGMSLPGGTTVPG